MQSVRANGRGPRARPTAPSSKENTETPVGDGSPPSVTRFPRGTGEASCCASGASLLGYFQCASIASKQSSTDCDCRPIACLPSLRKRCRAALASRRRTPEPISLSSVHCEALEGLSVQRVTGDLPLCRRHLALGRVRHPRARRSHRRGPRQTSISAFDLPGQAFARTKWHHARRAGGHSSTAC